MSDVSYILSIIQFGKVIQYYSHFTNEKPEAWNLKVGRSLLTARAVFTARINIQIAPSSTHLSLLTTDSPLGAKG